MCFHTTFEDVANKKKRKRSEFEGLSDEESTKSFSNHGSSDEETKSTHSRTRGGGRLLLKGRHLYKQRHLNPRAQVLWLRMLTPGTRMRRPFPLYEDREIFKTSNKAIYNKLNKNLIEHKKDDDYDTDLDVVDDHVDMCLEELRETIENFVNGDPLKLCRNARGEFSGL